MCIALNRNERHEHERNSFLYSLHMKRCTVFRFGFFLSPLPRFMLTFSAALSTYVLAQSRECVCVRKVYIVVVIAFTHFGVGYFQSFCFTCTRTAAFSVRSLTHTYTARRNRSEEGKNGLNGWAILYQKNVPFSRVIHSKCTSISLNELLNHMILLFSASLNDLKLWKRNT